MSMVIADSITLDATDLIVTKDGYLVGEAKISRAGNVQEYLGREIGLTGDDASKIFGVYRDPDVVFDKDSMLSLAGRPVTRDHPDRPVDSTTWKDLAVGQVSSVVKKDGDYVVASMAIMDKDAANEVMRGARSLSAGYTCNIVKDSGVSEDGTPYQYRQAGPLRFNHVAYLPNNNPRAGSTRIGDSQSTEEVTMTTKSVVLGDKAVQVSAEDAAILDKYKADMDKKLSVKDEEIGRLTVELIAAQDAAKIDIDALVAERSEMVAKVKAIDSAIVTDGVSNADLMRAAVASRFGADMVKDSNDDQIAGMFKAISLTAKATHPVASAVKDSLRPVADSETRMQDAYNASVHDLNAWRYK